MKKFTSLLSLMLGVFFINFSNAQECTIGSVDLPAVGFSYGFGSSLVGQTFQACETGVIKSISFGLSGNAQVGDFNLYIGTQDESNPTTTIASSSAPVDMFSITSTSATTVEITLANPFPVTAGTWYAFEVDSRNLINGGEASIRPNSDPAPGTVYIQFQSNSPVSTQGQDLDIAIEIGQPDPPSSNCFVSFERISDTELRMVGTGITTVSNLSGSGSFFNLIVNDLFATPPTSYDATVTQGDFTVNSFGARTTASSTTLGNSIFVSVGLTNSVSGNLLADGSLVLTWADGALADDVTCIPVLHQSFGNILCNPVISDITLSNISQCLEGNTFTADISVAHTQQSSLLGVNVEVSGDATASIPVTIQPDGSGQYTNSSLARRVTFVSDGQPINLTAQFVGFSNCVFSKEFDIEVDPCNIVIMPPCSIGTLTVITEDVCDGDNATFTLSFDAVSGSGDYDVIASADNAELGLTNGDVLGSIRGGATDGTGIEIIGTVPSTTTGATISVGIVDATTSTCTVPSSIPVTIAACVSTEPLPAMNRWGLILFSMIILGAGLLAYRRF